MIVIVEEIQQNYSLQTKGVTTYAVLKLPTGNSITVPLTDEQAQDIMQASISVRSPAPYDDQDQTDIEQEQLEQEQLEQPVEVQPERASDTVRWAELPDSIIAPQMKKVLADVGAASEMPYEALVSLVDEISEHLANQAEKDAKVAKVIGRVMKPRMPTPKRRQSVPTDDLGYPVVHPNRDSGETAAIADEDGIAQL